MEPKTNFEQEAAEATEATDKKLETSYFTFGPFHIHQVDGVIFNKDIIVKITAEDPRERMFQLFGGKWSLQYGELPERFMERFPRGIIDMST